MISFSLWRFSLCGRTSDFDSEEGSSSLPVAKNQLNQKPIGKNFCIGGSLIIINIYPLLQGKDIERIGFGLIGLNIGSYRRFEIRSEAFNNVSDQCAFAHSICNYLVWTGDATR